MVLTYREGFSSKYPWGVETTIHIEDDGKPIHSVVVMQWPKDEKEQAKRGAKLIANYQAQLAEAALPSSTLSREYVEKMLVDKGLLSAGAKVEDIKTAAEIKAAK